MYFLDDLTITYKYDWVLVKKGNGKNYMNFTKSDLLFENGRAHFKLDNLFNGDKLLGRCHGLSTKYIIFLNYTNIIICLV